MLESKARGVTYGPDGHIRGMWRVFLCLFQSTRGGGWMWYLSPWGPPYFKRDSAEASAKQMSVRGSIPLITGVTHGQEVAPSLAALLQSGVAGPDSTFSIAGGP